MPFGFVKKAITPAISLGAGVLTLLLFRRGIGFAPFSLAIALVAWGAAILFGRVFAKTDDDTGSVPSKRRRFGQWVSQTVVMGLYQNVLVFLLPIWFGSANFGSVNMVFPLLLAGLALFACFDDHFTKWVIARSGRRTVASAVLLFSVSVPIVVLTQRVPVRIGVGLSAGIVAFLAMLLGLSGRRISRRVAVGSLCALLVGGLFYGIAPVLPPVPVQCVSALAAGAMENRVPRDVSNTFVKGVPKVYAFFAVAAPERFRQNIQFQWYVNGEKRGSPIPSAIVGGRKRGFRTWTYRSHPHPGSYRVDLETAGGQLIGRVRFQVR